MKFEPSQATETLGPFFVEHALSDIPVFGPDKADVGAITDEAMQGDAPEDELLVDQIASAAPLPEAFTTANTVAEKLKALRQYIWSSTNPSVLEKLTSQQISDPMTLLRLQDCPEDPSKQSSRSLHEALLNSTLETSGFPKAAHAVLDHTMLLRAREKYLFDCRANRAVVDDDPWLRGVWGWIEGMDAVFSCTFCNLPLTDRLQMLKKPVSTVECWHTLWILVT